MKDFIVSIPLSGERFRVTYGLAGSESKARSLAEEICVEQTIEFPADLVKGGDIRRHILGRIESFFPGDRQENVQPSEENLASVSFLQKPTDDNKTRQWDGAPGEPNRVEIFKGNSWSAVISFAIESAGAELTQLLNVIFGNTSLIPGVRVEGLDLPVSLLKCFKGPRFGVAGLRSLLGVPERPLFCTALKPMGLSCRDLAELAYRFALGGVDLIKDDHGLADQPFAPFKERVQRCAEAVRRGNLESGSKCLYVPNLSAPADQILDKALFAKANGAGALMVAPGLIGPDSMRMLADDDRIALPIICHPAFLGTFTAHPHHGISHYVIFGQLPRLAGADASIFPNYGGRFSFSLEECQQVVRGASVPMGHFAPIFSAPGGGMSLERIPEMIRAYGREMIFLIGGALHRLGPDLVENCRRFMQAVGDRTLLRP